MKLLDERFCLRHRQVAVHDELFGVMLGQRGSVLDLAVHQRLRERRFVAFVVAVAAIAVQVDDHIAIERLAELQRQLGHVDGRLGILGVHVENGHLNHLGHVGAVGRRAGVARRCREADLVIDDQVNGAAGLVAGQLREVERFGHQALAGKRRIAVNQHGDAQLALAVAEQALLGPGAPFDHGIDSFQVTRIRRQGQVDFGPGEGCPVAGETEMVLDVAVAVARFGEIVLLELGEDLLVRFAQDVGQHIEPAAMGHAEHDLAHPCVRRLLHDGVQERDECLGPFE